MWPRPRHLPRSTNSASGSMATFDRGSASTALARGNSRSSLHLPGRNTGWATKRKRTSKRHLPTARIRRTRTPPTSIRASRSPTWRRHLRATRSRRRSRFAKRMHWGAGSGPPSRTRRSGPAPGSTTATTSTSSTSGIATRAASAAVSRTSRSVRRSIRLFVDRRLPGSARLKWHGAEERAVPLQQEHV